MNEVGHKRGASFVRDKTRETRDTRDQGNGHGEEIDIDIEQLEGKYYFWTEY